MHPAFRRVSLVIAAITPVAFPGSAHADNGVTPVIVQNPVTLNPATPNPVTVANPTDIAKAMGIQHPFMFEARALFSDNFCTVTANVPAKQRAVIETVSGSTNLPAGTQLLFAEVVTNTQASLTSPNVNPNAGADVQHEIVIPDHVGTPDGKGNQFVAFSQTLRAYADQGSVIFISMGTPSPGPNPVPFCFVSVSGQLIDVP